MSSSMRRISAMTASMAAAPFAASSADNSTLMRVPMMASSRAIHAAHAGAADANATAQTLTLQIHLPRRAAGESRRLETTQSLDINFNDIVETYLPRAFATSVTGACR